MGNVLHTFLNSIPTESIVDSSGMYLYASDGTKYLDFSSGSTHNSILGFNHPFVLNRVTEQLRKISNIDYKSWIDPNRETLASLIVGQAPNGLNRVFFAGQSGSEACEAALQLSYQVHYESGKKGKTHFISRLESYHGSTINAMVCGDRHHLRYMDPLLPKNHIKVAAHDPIHGPKEQETQDQYLERSISEIEDAIDGVGAERIAAFIGEPIMGGLQGDIPPHPDYWRRVSALCKKHDIHLILDEIYTGTGTSGKYFCSSWDEEVAPDFILIGKTLGAGYAPLCVVVTSDKIEQVIKNGSGRVSYSSTHQGHTLSTAAALAVQQYIVENNLPEYSRTLGLNMMVTIETELRSDPFFVGVHGRGVRFSLEYTSTDNISLGNELRLLLKNEYKIIIDAKWHRVGFRPAMICTHELADSTVSAVIDSFRKVSKKFRPGVKAKLYA
jgi:adenosylmethionine-8-amino-7-oxononanoate aminotransferase